VHWCH